MLISWAPRRQITRANQPKKAQPSWLHFLPRLPVLTLGRVKESNHFKKTNNLWTVINHLAKQALRLYTHLGNSPQLIFLANITAAKSSPTSTTDAKESSHPYSIISLNRTYCHWLWRPLCFPVVASGTFQNNFGKPIKHLHKTYVALEHANYKPLQTQTPMKRQLLLLLALLFCSIGTESYSRNSDF